MTYNPNVPANGSENISISQPKITDNFTAMNNIFDNDHYTFNEAVTARRGLHKQITFPAPLVADPSTSNSKGSLYTKADVNDASARPQLYYQNVNGVNNVWQLTNRFQSTSANGYWMLPLGSPSDPSLILMWGNATIPGSSTSGQIPITYSNLSNYAGSPTGFPNAVYSVQYSIKADGSADSPKTCIDTSFYALSGFQIRYSSNAATTPTIIYWFAIGS